MLGKRGEKRSNQEKQEGKGTEGREVERTKRPVQLHLAA